MGKQIVSYSVLSRGFHTNTTGTLVTLQTTATSVTTNTADPYVNTLLTYDTATGNLDVDLIGAGINIATLLGAQIRLGPPELGGPVILSLPAPSAWQDMGGQGVALSALDQQVPAPYAAALLAGNAYLVVLTQNFPNGEIRGNITPIPEPASLSLLVLGGLALIRLRRRSSPYVMSPRRS
jgi:hypothetical protein